MQILLFFRRWCSVTHTVKEILRCHQLRERRATEAGRHCPRCAGWQVHVNECNRSSKAQRSQVVVSACSGRFVVRFAVLRLQVKKKLSNRHLTNIGASICVRIFCAKVKKMRWRSTSTTDRKHCRAASTVRRRSI